MLNTLAGNSRPQSTRFLALIPHPETKKPLEEYRRLLFAGGFAGAYSFPLAAPLALVGRRLTQEELKAVCREARNATLPFEGTITASETAVEPWPLPNEAGPVSLFGPLLNLALPDILAPVKDSVKAAFPRPILCAALLPGSGEEKPALPSPSLRFRAAQIAVIAIRPLTSGNPLFSREWRVIQSRWLPPYRAKKEG